MTNAILVAAGVLLVLRIAYQATPLRRHGAAAARTRRELRRSIKRTRRILRSRRKDLLDAARRYIGAQARARLRAIPIEQLREHAGANLRLAALREAGYETLADLAGVPARRLVTARGVGPRTAAAVAKEVKKAVALAEAEPPPLPDAQLTQARSLELARACLVYLRAFRLLADLPEQLEACVEQLFAGRPRGGFPRWLLDLTRPGANAARAARLEELAAEARELADSGIFAAAAAHRDTLRDEGRTPPRDHEVRAPFQEQYADCCAVLEGVFGELGEHRKRKAARGAPTAAPEGRAEVAAAFTVSDTAVARKVEGYRLDASGLKVVLRRYQEFGAKFILAQERTVLGDEMGLGKTIEALAAIVHLAPGSFLVVAPASILANWRHEIAHRTALPHAMLHGDGFADALARWRADGGVAVTSYTTLRRNAAAVAEHGPATLDLLVADEAHYAKNPDALRTRALRDIAARAERVCFMSGTPMENHPDEFAALVETLAPPQVGDLDAFVQSARPDLGSARGFHARVASVYLRRNQEDVLRELPEKIVKNEWVDLSERERDVYGRSVFAGDFMGMRQAVTLGDGAGPSAKLERLDEIVAEHREEERKVLVFSYFLDVLERVAGLVPNLGRIVGSVPPDRRFALVQEFQQAPGHQVLLLQVVAGGQGLNLHAASAVVFMEPQLKPTQEAQAVARAHRMGQTRRVVVHRLLARDTVDERLDDLVGEKRELFDRFARKSLVKEASAAATETGLVQTLLRAERDRLSAG